MPKQKKDPNNELSPKEELFCSLYVSNGFNGSKAASESGWSHHTAAVKASQLLTKVKIQQKVKELNDAALKKAEITADEVVRRLAVIARQRLRNVATFDGKQLTFKSLEEMGDFDEAIESVETETDMMKGPKGEETGIINQHIKMKFHDKKGALDSLAKYFKMFSDEVPVDPNRPNTTVVILPANGFEPKPRTQNGNGSTASPT